MYTTRYAERKPGLNKSQGCWHCIILYYPLISMYKIRYKKPLQTIKDGPVSQPSFLNWFLGILAPPLSNFSLSLSPSPSLSFSGWIPIWGVEALWVYLLALASKTHVRGSPRRGTLHYSSGRQRPNVDGTSSLSWNFIGFPRKPSYSASFLHLFSYYTISFQSPSIS